MKITENFFFSFQEVHIRTFFWHWKRTMIFFFSIYVTESKIMERLVVKFSKIIKNHLDYFIQQIIYQIEAKNLHFLNNANSFTISSSFSIYKSIQYTLFFYGDLRTS